MFKNILRTERITETRLGDIVDGSDAKNQLKVMKEDITSYMEAQKLLDEIGLNVNVPMDYVKSTPYLMSFMKDYQLKRKIERYFKKHVRQVDKIKKLDPKDKEKYTEEIKKTLKLTDDETFDIKDIKAFGKTLKSKGIEIKEETVPTGLSPKAKAYREYLENVNNSMKNGEGIYKYAPRFLPTNYDIYKGAANL